MKSTYPPTFPCAIQPPPPHTWAANPLCLQENYRFRWSLNWWVADSLLSPTTSSSRRTNERTCQRQTTFRGTWWTNKTDNKGASSQISMTIKSHQTKTLWTLQNIRHLNLSLSSAHFFQISPGDCEEAHLQVYLVYYNIIVQGKSSVLSLSFVWIATPSKGQEMGLKGQLNDFEG